jgi:predicted RNA-binding protein with PIN domain
MPFLIDGYNLLHAMGLLRGRAGPYGLAKARAGLLGLLASTHGGSAGEVTVVFDARRAPAAVGGEEYHGSVRVEFTHREEADDRIEWLIAHDAAPKRLVVVSDDRRLQRAARRRHCTAWKCSAYLDWLDRQRRERRREPRPEPGKPEAVSPDEAEHWLDAFASLSDEPEFRDIFDTPDNDEASGGRQPPGHELPGG